MAYSFQEVAQTTGIRPYVLRFWESEFDVISPSLSSSGDKIYSENDLRCIQIVKKLLFEKKCSVPQAKLELDKILGKHDGPTRSSTSEREANKKTILRQANRVKNVAKVEVKNVTKLETKKPEIASSSAAKTALPPTEENQEQRSGVDETIINGILQELTTLCAEMRTKREFLNANP